MDSGPDHGSKVYVRADRAKSQPRTPASQLPCEPLTTLVAPALLQASPGDHTPSSPTPLPAHRFGSVTSFRSLSAPSSSPPNPDAVLTLMPRLMGTPCGGGLGGGTAVPTHQQTHWSRGGGDLPEVTQLVGAEAELESWGLLHGLRCLLGSAGFAPSQEMSPLFLTPRTRLPAVSVPPQPAGGPGTWLSSLSSEPRCLSLHVVYLLGVRLLHVSVAYFFSPHIFTQAFLELITTFSKVLFKINVLLWDFF